MTPRFQADEDFNQKIVLGLRRKEPAIDIRDARDAGLIGLLDPEVLRIAAESGRILLSHDRGTMPGHLTVFLKANTNPGIIVVSQDLDIGSAMEDLLVIWVVWDATEWRDQVGFVPL